MASHTSTCSRIVRLEAAASPRAAIIEVDYVIGVCRRMLCAPAILLGACRCGSCVAFNVDGRC